MYVCVYVCVCTYPTTDIPTGPGGLVASLLVTLLSTLYICSTIDPPQGLVVCLLFNFFCASVMLGTQAGQRVASWFLAGEGQAAAGGGGGAGRVCRRMRGSKVRGAAG